MASAQTTWDNFEDQRKGTYGFISGTFIPYSENPDQSGVNTSPVAGFYARNPAEQFDVLILDAQMADLSDYLTGAKTMSMDVWSPAAGTTVQITLENDPLAEPANFPTGRHSVYLATTTTSMAWETLTFTFDNQPDASVANDNVNRMVILFDPDSNSGDEWRFDNLRGPELADDPCDGVPGDSEVMADFECQQNINFTFSHSGVNFRRILNPDPTGANNSDYVARYVRNGGEENDVLIASQFGEIPILAGDIISMNVWDAAAPTEVILSLQDASGNIIIAPTSNTSIGNTWETLNFDVGSVAGANVEQIVILFDPGNFSSGEYFWDNLQFGGETNTFETLSGLNDFKVYPNPVKGIANFQFDLAAGAEVSLTVSDISGKLVDTVIDGFQSSGSHTLEWNTDNVNNGLYFYTLAINGNVATGKITVVK